MLFRVSCKTCHLSSIWTDDPQFFLQSVCLKYRHCAAKLVEEGPARVPRRKSALPAATAGLMTRKKSAEPAHSLVSPPAR